MPGNPARAGYLDAWRATVGSALRGSTAGTEEARTQAAATAWKAQRDHPARPQGERRLGDAVVVRRGDQRRAAAPGRDLFGGLAPVAYSPPGWIAARGSTAIVQVPTNVRADRFGDVLGAHRQTIEASRSADGTERRAFGFRPAPAGVSGPGAIASSRSMPPRASDTKWRAFRAAPSASGPTSRAYAPARRIA